MGSLEGGRPGGRPGDRVAPGEIVYESATTRVVRVRADGSISKEALGADGHRRIRHEQGILRHLSGVAGVVRIRATSPSRALLQLDDGGVALAEVLQRRRLALPEVLLLVEQLARVLAAVHKAGVFHRDVCPANIVVPSAEVLVPPLLIDFDRAATASAAPSDSFTGTLRYAAPEQSGRTARAADHRSDVYSLGVLLYELATGRLPFDSADPLELMRDHMVREPVPPIELDPSVPQPLSDVILRALAKDPDARYEELEARVRARTEELEKVQGQLVATARRAGMAQVASNVLHNVGNILTSVTVAAAMLQKRLRGSHSLRLSRAVALVKEHENDFADFVGRDERGKLLPGYLQKLDEAIEEERQNALGDVDTLVRSIDHINAVVSSQQIYAGTSSVAVEPVALGELVDEALRMNFPDTSLARTQVDCDCTGIPTLQIDKLRLMQILVNLIANSVEAMDDVEPDRPRLLSIRATLAGAPGAERLRIAVQDSGHGIDPENVPRLFTHGFTTKRKGHGFGLHGAAIAAMEMGGELTPHSEGPGRGATFTLDVPVRR